MGAGVSVCCKAFKKRLSNVIGERWAMLMRIGVSLLAVLMSFVAVVVALNFYERLFK
jgi:hypothetical protein